MALSFGSGDVRKDSVGYVNSLTQSFTVAGSDPILVVVVASRDLDIITGITYNSVSLTKKAEYLNASVCGASIWVLENPSTGANDVVLSASGYKLWSMYIFQLNGAPSSNAVEATNTGNGYSAAPSTSLTTITDGAWIVDAINLQNTKTISANAGQTERNNADHSDANLGQMAVSTKPKTTAGSESLGYTWTGGDNWAHGLIAIKPKAGEEKALSDSQSITESIKKNITLNLTDSLSINESINNTLILNLSNSLSITESLQTTSPEVIGIVSADSAQFDYENTKTISNIFVTGNNRIMVVGVGANSPATISGITYNSVAFTEIDTYDNVNVEMASLWYLIAPATGTHDLVINFSNYPLGNFGYVLLTGGDQTDPIGVTDKGDEWTAAPSHNVTTTKDGSMVIDILGLKEARAKTVGSGQIEQWDNNYGAMSTEFKEVAGVVTMSWSWTGGANVARVIAEFKAAFGTGALTASLVDSMTISESLAFSGGTFNLGLSDSISIDESVVKSGSAVEDEMATARGCAMAGLEFAHATIPGVEGTNYTKNLEADYEYIASKGFKTVRLPFTWERVQPTLNGALDATYLGYINENIAWAAAHGLKIILDVHNYGRCYISGTEYIIGDGTLTTAHFADLWDRLSQEFRDNDTVIAYDLMNEPHDMPVPTTSSNYKTTATATLMFQAAVDAIRANNDSKYCIIELDGWAGMQEFTNNYGANPDLWITDTENRIVYSGHYYMDDDHSGTYPIAFKSSNNTDISGDVTPFMSWCQTKGIKGRIGEFGVPNEADWQVCLDTLLNLADTYSVWWDHWASGSWYTSITTLQPTDNYQTDRLQMTELLEHLPDKTQDLSDSITFAESLYSSPNIQIQDDLYIEESVTLFAIVKGLSDTLAIAESIDTGQFIIYKDLSDSLSIAESLLNISTLGLSETFDLFDEVTFDFGKVLTDTQTIVEAILKGMSFPISDSLTFSESKVWITGKNIIDSINLSETSVKSYVKFLNDTLVLSESVQIGSILNKTEALSIAEAVGNFTTITNSDSISISESINTVKEFYRSLTDLISITEESTRQVAKPVSDLIAISESVIYESGFGLLDSISFAESFISELVKNITDSLSISESEAKEFSLPLSDSVSIAESVDLDLVLGRDFDESVAISEDLQFIIEANKTESLPIAESVGNDTSLILSDTISITESLILTYDKNLSEEQSIIESSVSVIEKNLIETLSISESVDSQCGFPLSDSLGVSESSTRQIIKILSDILPISSIEASEYSLYFSDTLLIIEGSVLENAFLRELSESVSISVEQGFGIIEKLSDNISFSENKVFNIAVNQSEDIDIYALATHDNKSIVRLGCCAFIRQNIIPRITYLKNKYM